METYKLCPIIRLCLHYFSVIISNHLNQQYNDVIFRKDGMSVLYTKELVDTMNACWTPDKINIVLDLIRFLDTNTDSAANVRSLETIVENNDKEMLHVFAKL